MADDKLSKIFKLLDEKAVEDEKPVTHLYESTDDSNTILNNLSKPNFILLKKLAKKYNESPLSLIKKISGDGISIGKTIDFSKGGTPMMRRQMELFEDGGLKDEGGMTESKSGNSVPSGSSRKEVADDIPAMLSEGEFVFPADVTRYIGLDKLMSLRQDAKRGLSKMEDMGQMGEEREVSEDEELPFGMADLIVVSEGGEPLEMAEGGVASTRSLATSAVPTRPNRQTTYKEIMGQNRILFKEYRNAAGKSMTIAFLGNVPLYPIPDGYTYYDPDNPDSHVSVAGGIAPVTAPNILVEETRDYSGEEDEFGRPVGSVHTPPNYAAMDNTEFDSSMKLKYSSGNGTNIALALVGFVNPVLGIAASAGNAWETRNNITLMENRLNNGNLTARQKTNLSEHLSNARKSISNTGATIALNVIDAIGNVLGIEPKVIDDQKAAVVTIKTTAATGTKSLSETVEETVTEVNKQMTTDQSFTPTTQQISNQQMTTGQTFTPQQLANQQMTTGLSNNVVDNIASSSVADAIAQKSMPTVEFNPVTGQLESKSSFTPVADPTFDRFVSDKAAVGRPIDRIDPNLGMPMDASMIDMTNINKVDSTLGMPMNPISTPAAGVGYDIGLGDTSTKSVAPVTDDYGNAFGKGMANNVTSDFSGSKSLDSQIDMMDLGYGTPVDSPYSTGYGGGYTPKGISDPQPSGIQDSSQVPTYDSQTPQGIQDPSQGSKVAAQLTDAYQNYNPYGTTATTSTKQTADSFIDAPTTDSIVSKDNQAFYDAQQQKQTQDAFSFADSLNPQGPTYTTIAPSLASSVKPDKLPPAIDNSLVSNVKPDKLPSFIESKPVAPVEVKKYKPENIVPGAYTGSGMNNTISPGSKIAGVTSVEGVVPDSKNPNEVSKVSKTLSNGNVTNHTVFSNTKGDLYAKNPFGSTFSVTKNSDGTFTAGDKTPESMPTDAQPKSIFSDIFSGGTKSTPTKSEGEAPATSTSGNVSTGGVTSGVGTGTSVGLADEGSDGGDGPDGKIVCTEMYRQTNLDDWAKAMKMWDVYQRKYLTPVHQVGYHWLFKPYVKGMRKSTILTSLGSLLAEKRTQHIKHILTKGKAKDNLIGKIWCNIIHPIVYTAGKVKLYTKKRY